MKCYNSSSFIHELPHLMLVLMRMPAIPMITITTPGISYDFLHLLLHMAVILMPVVGGALLVSMKVSVRILSIVAAIFFAEQSLQDFGFELFDG